MLLFQTHTHLPNENHVLVIQKPNNVHRILIDC